uniref:Uncharacterized protein n=1 Tax=viral metagenome TaxID=1070528 RepID=A0A6C0IM13_9ZZZZ
MFKLAATRFNEETWKENEKWRETNKYNGCLYSNPRNFKDKIIDNTTVFILEMHNDENKIKGIGMIKKQSIISTHTCRIYSDGNYNRYTYKSPYRIDMSELTGYNKAIVEVFDILLFKTKKHIKRAQGITELPKWILNNKHFNFIQFFRDLFQEKFPQAILTEKTEL